MRAPASRSSRVCCARAPSHPMLTLTSSQSSHTGSREQVRRAHTGFSPHEVSAAALRVCVFCTLGVCNSRGCAPGAGSGCWVHAPPHTTQLVTCFTDVTARLCATHRVLITESCCCCCCPQTSLRSANVRASLLSARTLRRTLSGRGAARQTLTRWTWRRRWTR